MKPPYIRDIVFRAAVAAVFCIIGRPGWAEKVVSKLDSEQKYHSEKSLPSLPPPLFPSHHHHFLLHSHDQFILVNKTLVPINESIVSSNFSRDNAQKRSDEFVDSSSAKDSNDKKFLFKYLIPQISPFKKPIKKIFKSWFEPDQEALEDDSTKSTFYLTKPQKTIFQPPRALFNKNVPDSVETKFPQSSYTYPPKPINYINRAQYSSGPHEQLLNVKSRSYQSYEKPKSLFAIGDPENGRGMTVSFGDQQAPQAQASTSYGSKATEDSSAGGGHRGFSLSLGGRNGGSGMSINLGNGGSGGGSGMSFSFGGGGNEATSNGGSGMSLNFGGGYQQSGSSNYPSYSSANGGGSNYGYKNNGYGYNNYPPQPTFSVVMPSSGKKVIEYNQHPPKLKMKINSSPKIKITTNTKDPLEKPPLDDEPIQDDIFGPPEPFDKQLNKTGSGSMDAFGNNQTMNMMMFNQTMFPFMNPMAMISQFPQYYQYPYNYYYNYYQQQYPQYYSSFFNNSFQKPPSSSQPNQLTQSPHQPNSMAPMSQYPSNMQFSANQISLSQYPQVPSNQFASPPPGAQPQSNPFPSSLPLTSSYSSQYSPPMQVPQNQFTSNPMQHMTSSVMPSQYPSNQYASSQYSSSVPIPTPVPNQFVHSNQQYQYPVAINSHIPQHPQIASTKTPHVSSSANINQRAPPNQYPSYQPGQQASLNMAQHYPSASSAYPTWNTYQNSKSYSLPPISTDGYSNYKRSSASRNYQKDMLTLGSNIKPTYSKPQYSSSYQSKTNPTNSKIMYSESKNYYRYEMSPKDVSYSYSNPNSLASNNLFQYNQGQPGTGNGFSFFNMTSQYNGSFPGSVSHSSPPTNTKTSNSMATSFQNPNQQYQNPYYYYNPYYYNYYSNYYNYAKQYYNSMYGNYSSYYKNYYKKKNKTSISGYNQNSFDHHQSKIFGSRIIQYPGGDTKEDKARVILDVRPRITFRNLNKTEQAMQDEELKKKKKDHIFKTMLTVIMQSTTTSTPKPYYNYDNYYGYNYGPEEDEFGYTHESPYATSAPTTSRPKTTTTTRRRTTTTEAASSSESSSSEASSSETSEESNSEETSSGEESTTTTSTTTTTEMSEKSDSSSEEITDDESGSKEETTTMKLTTTTPASTTEEVIDGNEEMKDENLSKENMDDEKSTEEKTDEEGNSKSMEDDKMKPKGPASSIRWRDGSNNVTVSPELVAAMIKALQEALGLNNLNATQRNVAATTQVPPKISTLIPFDNEDILEEIDETMNEDTTTTKTTTTTSTEKTSTARNKSKQTPMVVSAIVKNTTMLRLKTPVLNVQSTNSPMDRSTSPSERKSSRLKPFKRNKASNNESFSEESTTTKKSTSTTTSSPFIIVNKKTGNKKNNGVNKVIDGNAVLSNFDVDDLTDNERRDMLTNILGIIQNRLTPVSSPSPLSSTSPSNSTNSESTMSTTTMSSKNVMLKSTSNPNLAKLMSLANNVQIISSLDELSSKSQSSDKASDKKPVYVVLMPQNKKKKK